MVAVLALGLIVSLAAMAVHCASLLSLNRILHWGGSLKNLHELVHLLLAVAATMGVMLAAHLLEVGIWAAVFHRLHLTGDWNSAIYDAFLTYTSMGTGHLRVNTVWRVLEPMATLNGIMLAGLSTAAMFAVLTRSHSSMQPRRSN